MKAVQCEAGLQPLDASQRILDWDSKLLLNHMECTSSDTIGKSNSMSIGYRQCVCLAECDQIAVANAEPHYNGFNSPFKETT